MTSRFKFKRSANTIAKLLLINAARYGVEKGKEVSRFRLSKDTFRTISGYRRISEKLYRDVEDALGELGWTLLDVPDTEMAVIQTSKVGVWPKLSSKRLVTIGLLKIESEDHIDAVYLSECPEPPLPIEADD